MRASRVIAGLLLWVMASCGYSARRSEVALGGASRPGNQKIFIPLIDNLTVRTGTEAAITDSLRKTLANVRGVELVESAKAADFFLIGTLTKHQLDVRTVRLGRASTTETVGGLAQGQSTAFDLTLTIGLRVQLVEKTGEGPAKREVWIRDFEKSAIFEASARDDKGRSLTGASAAAPHISSSREEIQVRVLADLLARQVLDQVVQDF